MVTFIMTLANGGQVKGWVPKAFEETYKKHDPFYTPNKDNMEAMMRSLFDGDRKALPEACAQYNPEIIFGGFLKREMFEGIE